MQQKLVRDKELGDPDKCVRRKTVYQGPKKSVSVYKRLTTSDTAPTQQLINQLKISQIKEEQEQRYHFNQKNKTQTDLLQAYENMEPKQHAKIPRQVSSSLHLKSSATTRPASSKINYGFTARSGYGDGSQTHRPFSALTHESKSHVQINNYSQNIQESHKSKTSLTRPQSAVSVQPKNLFDWNVDDLRKRIDYFGQSEKYSKDCLKVQKILDKKNLIQKFSNLIESCKTARNANQKDEKQMKSKLKMMENDIQEELEQIEKTDFEKPPSSVQTQVQQAKGEKFAEFKRERNFKRKLIGFLIDKVEKKSDLISKYNGKKWTEELLAQITQRSD